MRVSNFGMRIRRGGQRVPWRLRLVEGESAGAAMSTVIVVADGAGNSVLEMPVSEAIASLDSRPRSN